uniref:Reverse transcriptase zinc-binding domain-containing protein n=1 Tax=Solanum lycopersicum TaxID=4081 RepID=A0A3Q7EX03_SOLLC
MAECLTSVKTLDSCHLHLVANCCIVRYFLGRSPRGLFFSDGFEIQLNAFRDFDWAGCPDTRRYVMGWCRFLGDSLLFWKGKNQDRVSKSSTKNEYRAMSTCLLTSTITKGRLLATALAYECPWLQRIRATGLRVRREAYVFLELFNTLSILFRKGS